MIKNRKTIIKESKSSTETQEIGKWLSKNLRKDSVVALCGEFGAGKTVFAKGIAEGLGVKDVLHSVISPSFALVREYEGKIPIFHFDLYRIKTLDELSSVGYEDYLMKDGVVIIEWAEKFLPCFPDDIITVYITIISETERKIKFMFPQ